MEVWLIYSVVLISAVWQGDLVVYTYMFFLVIFYGFIIFSFMVYHTILKIVLCNRTFWF